MNPTSPIDLPSHLAEICRDPDWAKCFAAMLLGAIESCAERSGHFPTLPQIGETTVLIASAAHRMKATQQ